MALFADNMISSQKAHQNKKQLDIIRKLSKILENQVLKLGTISLHQK